MSVAALMLHSLKPAPKSNLATWPISGGILMNDVHLKLRNRLMVKLTVMTIALACVITFSAMFMTSLGASTTTIIQRWDKAKTLWMQFSEQIGRDDVFGTG
jgi:hypothetical protein